MVSLSSLSLISAPWKLVTKQATVYSWLTFPSIDNEMSESNKWNSFILLIAHSTWILTFAIVFVCKTSWAENWVWFWRKEGKFKETCLLLKRSSISHPLSTITLSCVSRKTKMREQRVIYLSDIEPVYRLEKNVMAPWGAIPIKPFKVVLDLYDKYSWDCNNNEKGVWTLISVQSMMTRVDGYSSLKLSGISSLMHSLVGQYWLIA